MKRFIEGENRFQSTLFPESLEDYIAADNPVRVIDAFVDGLDLKQLGFDRAEPSETGRPGYEPAVMLKRLCLRIPEPSDNDAGAGAGDAQECGADLADRSADAELQDNRRVQALKPQGGAPGVCGVCGYLPAAEVV